MKKTWGLLLAAFAFGTLIMAATAEAATLQGEWKLTGKEVKWCEPYSYSVALDPYSALTCSYLADIPWNVTYTSAVDGNYAIYTGQEFNVTLNFTLTKTWKASSTFMWSAPPATLSPGAKYTFSMGSKRDNINSGSILISALDSNTNAPGGWQYGSVDAALTVAEYTAPAAPATATEKRVIAVQLYQGGSIPTQTYRYIYEWSGSSPVPVISGAVSTTATVGQAFSYQTQASESPFSYSASGLPAGLSINTMTGLISGTPSSAGTYTVKLGATNSSGTGSSVLTLVVTQASSGTNDSDRVFNWAEAIYPELFSPALQTTKSFSGYTYRYYKITNSYLATSADGHVYYVGALSNGQIMDVGLISAYLTQAKAAGY